MQIAILLLLSLVGVFLFVDVNPSFGEQEQIPEWVKTTLSMWSDGHITNEEFVRAIDYLSEQGIVKISSIDDKELQRHADYLKAKSEVLEDEVKQLREENKEFRILLKSQKISKSNDYPATMSKLFDEYQALQNEIKSLRATNQQFSKQIDSWITSNGIPEQRIPSNVKDDERLQAESQHVKKINDLTLENKAFVDQIRGLEEKATSYQNDIDMLNLEIQNNQELIAVLKVINQENRLQANQLIQNDEEYELLITDLKNENFAQKQKMIEYEEKIKSLDEKFNTALNQQQQNEANISLLETQNSNFEETISRLEGINQTQKEQLAGVLNDLVGANNVISSLSGKIDEYAVLVNSLKDDSVLLENKIEQTNAEKTRDQEKISRLEQENAEQRKILVEIMNEAQESDEFQSVLDSRLANYQELVDNLKTENDQYRQAIGTLEHENIEKNTSLILMKNTVDDLNNLVTDLNSKIKSHENTINVLSDENNSLKNDLIPTNKQKISEFESKLHDLEGEKTAQNEFITRLELEIEESNALVNELNSKISSYQNQIKLFENENMQYKNEISSLKNAQNIRDAPLNAAGDTLGQTDSMIQLLTEQNSLHQKTIDDLKEENKILEKKARVANNDNADNLILMSEIHAENNDLKKQISFLQSEIKEKHDQITSLKNTQVQTDVDPQDSHAQKSTLSLSDGMVDELTKKNDMLLVELNYLKAKNLVNDEEIQVLRDENKEYRVLLNLLKKGQKSVTGIDSVNHDYMNETSVQGVMFKTTDIQKNLPGDWISQIKNSKTQLLFVEPTPKWSKDMSVEVRGALDYWKQIANVEFKIVSTSSSDITTIEWEKELRNDFDGYTIGQTHISIGLGSTNCDGTWRPYSSESIKNILIHEIGHTLGLGHAAAESNIMYPMIDDAKFAPLDQTVVIPGNDSVFVKGCSFSADPSYKYQVSVQDSNKVDVFFVPSIDEKYKVDSGKSFNYYSDINCIGLDKSHKSGMCTIANSGGMLVINSNDHAVATKLHLEEQ
ncbi:MAG: matrixin family metalloprotease [Nitrosarchaeum sp.]|nr:matrixin family metalloprotease [Nitrosarchaeum sp.]MCV0399087.1 matrixin family metalloprotease [Nitrosarchaeum sp.]